MTNEWRTDKPNHSNYVLGYCSDLNCAGGNYFKARFIIKDGWETYQLDPHHSIEYWKEFPNIEDERWEEVSDKTPKSQDLLCVDNKNEQWILASNIENKWSDEYFDKEYNVLKWMFLPEPPSIIK